MCGWVEEAKVMLPPSIPPLKEKPCTLYLHVCLHFVSEGPHDLLVCVNFCLKLIEPSTEEQQRHK